MLALHLHSFRSYRKASFVFDQPVVYISGPNGAGKTNLLEALSLLAPGRGIRDMLFPQFLHTGEDAWHLQYALTTPTGPLDIKMSWTRETAKRTMTLNGAPLRALTGLMEWVRILWMTPATERMWSEAPSGRRKYFDRLVFSVFPSYAALWMRYEKGVRERQQILLEGRSKAWLDGLEAILAQDMVSIADYRQQTLSLLKEPLAASLIDGPLTLRLSGAFEELPCDCPTLVAKLQSSRHEDTIRKAMRWGPHRSLFEVFDTRGREAASCSTGEQKALLFSLTLALARLLRTMYPSTLFYLLMDELMAHLDAHKRSLFLKHILDLDFHVWITGNDAGFLPSSPSIQHLSLPQQDTPCVKIQSA